MTEISKKAEIIDNVYTANIAQLPGYVVKFGNAYYGYHIKDKEDLPIVWLYVIRRSQGQYPGDVALLKDGKCIRSLWNGERSIFDKTTRYPYTLNKYCHDNSNGNS